MKIALVAHDAQKASLLQWCLWNRKTLSRHELVATGTTGTIIEQEAKLPVRRLLSGPKGGDQQVGAMIATQELDALFFFWDPESPQPHDPDVKALLRLATLWNIPYACNTSTADLIISSPLFESDDYEPIKPDFGDREVALRADGSVEIDG
jgi:methylglyoxal synthase